MFHEKCIKCIQCFVQLVFSFNTGSGAAVMRTEHFFNDGEWHNAVMERQGEEGKLYVDGFLLAHGNSRGESNSIDLQVDGYCFSCTQR